MNPRRPCQWAPIHDPATIFANRTVNLGCEHPRTGYEEDLRDVQAEWMGHPRVGHSGRSRADGPGCERVAFEGGVQPGTIVIKTSERRLYLALGVTAAPSAIPSLLVGPENNGSAGPRSTASTCARLGRRRLKSSGTIRGCLT